MATGIENLKIYQMARELELNVHNVTKKFPREEKFRSTDQLNRSSSSVTNNIAEAYYKQSAKEKIHILRDVVITEAEETRTNLERSAQKEFLDRHGAERLCASYIELRRAVFGYIKFLKNYNASSSTKLINSSTHQLIN